MDLAEPEPPFSVPLTNLGLRVPGDSAHSWWGPFTQLPTVVAQGDRGRSRPTALLAAQGQVAGGLLMLRIAQDNRWSMGEG